MKTSDKTALSGPHLGITASVFAALFIAGLGFVVSFSPGAPHYPGPWESTVAIMVYFKSNASDAMMCGALQAMSAIPLLLFSATVYSKFRLSGIRSTGTAIAFAGGMMVAINLMISGLALWVLAQPTVTESAPVTITLYNLVFAIGGVGYSVPMGVLIGGICSTAGLHKLLPKGLLAFGVLIALCGALSWLSLIVPEMLPLIPLTRFPGFIWLIWAGFCISRTGPTLTAPAG